VTQATGSSASAKNIPGVIAPPPLIFFAAVILGVVLDLIWPVAFLPATAQYWVGGVVIGAGFALVIPAFRNFRAVGEHPDPSRPTGSLVLTGPYRYTHNPMYL
jgi:protein-S-isoprenylcysteine O-methyltransferase Ste14